MDVDENAPLFEGYQLKLNSYDLGVDIELADALERLRFEHPAVRVVLLRSGKQKVFCAGANIRMLAGSTHAHKVNFCKFTNETRNAIEDASEFSGQKMICVVTGSCAGGGYELALAADHIILTDDGSSTVSLPELPLLAVLPGTGGLTRVTDKRKVRRDHADVFCTTEEGVKGKRAVDWRLVDEVVPNTRLEDNSDAARPGVCGQSPNGPKDAKGISLTPLKRARSADGVEYSAVSVEILRARSGLPPSPCADRMRAPPKSAGEMAAQGAEFWPLRLARELDDAILDIRLNEFDTAVIVFKSEGDPEAVLAYDKFLDANAKHWLAREILLKWKRVLKRVDLTSRSLVALIEPGSCFAGTLAELVFAADRSYMLIGRLDGDNRPPAAIVLGDANIGGGLPMSNGLTRLATRFLGEPESLEAARQAVGEKLDAEKAERARPRHLRARRHRLGGRNPRVPRGARELLARWADRHGGEPALRRTGDHGNEDLRAADRLAELDLPAPQRGRRGGRAAPLRHRPEGRVRHEEGVRQMRLSSSAKADDPVTTDDAMSASNTGCPPSRA